MVWWWDPNYGYLKMERTICTKVGKAGLLDLWWQRYRYLLHRKKIKDDKKKKKCVNACLKGQLPVRTRLELLESGLVE